MRKFARRLIDHHTSADGSSASINRSAFPVPEELRPKLAALIGNGGFRALLLRALALAAAELPWLRSAGVAADGSLEWVDESRARPGPDEFFNGRVVLLAQLLGLLAAFIGESLTFEIVREVWPKVSLDDLILGNRVDHEKPN